MKKKSMLALLLSTILFGSLLSGCASPEKEAEGNNSENTPGVEAGLPDYLNPVGEYPITKEKIKIKVMGKKDPGGSDWGELEIFKRLAEKTNIELEFELSEGDSFNEQKNIALVGGEYADIILRGADKTDEETYGPQGVFLDLTNLIDQYAPNLKALMEKDPVIKASITSMDGKIYGLPYIFNTSMTQGHLGFFDSQWMKNVGIEKVPTTTDELYEMLKAFKEKDANGNGDLSDEIPFSAVGLNAFQQLLVPAFTGLTGGIGFDVNDAGEVVYVPAMKEYKDFLIYTNKLYKEGLIDPEFTTQTSQQWQAKVKGGLVGIYNASPTVLDPEAAKSEQLSLGPLTSPVNDKKVVRSPFNLYTSKAIITDKAKHPEAAMRLLDMFYATEDKAVDGFSGNTIFVGYEGEHWKYTDDTKAQYEWIDPITGFGDINKSISVNMELPGYLDFIAMPANNPLMEMKVTQVKEKQVPYYRDAYPVNARFTAKESEKGNVIENDLFTYVTLMTTKFIIGEESLDNFDSYIATLDKMGLQELLTIKTDALKRWNESLK
ncbi:carbohydrate ABC transporter substrate-binding protein, CUT1 family (TC 3.A.1.1.-) [Paenibacillus uliginis N3/975]|uniref:Carbohydrate ABC transporter substrate-binding protein, CUT1 family (TC 3.A.1.1.-) n=1 Tax=Paenibacillus uliginis N3/975 TaxID=1313296 RepID=A0A1X7GVS6_9BACL|nr:extracellular solute-binding protein [Paenibacillus uliginis]SMF75451.1 carbohydrate ABC transporter substrate-binding protein, CUT1 family (TC 3.A.1.1.-) [Paenibacillus uliginis N3/975]